MKHVNLVLLFYLEQLVKTQWNFCSLHASSKSRTLFLSAGKSSCMTVSCPLHFCNTPRFLMILSFGIWPLCLHKQDQAVGIKRPLRQCPGRIWSHNLPVQVPASCKHCKYNAMEIQHFSHFFLCTSTSFYIVVYLQSLLTPSGIFNIPGCGLLVQWRAQGSLQHAWCGACCTNAHLVILPTLLKTVDVFPCHFCPAQLGMVFMLFILSCSFNWVFKRINNCELSQCTAFLEGAPPSCHKQKLRHICMWFKRQANTWIRIHQHTAISPNMRVTILHACSWLFFDAGRLIIGFSDFYSQLQKRLRRSQSSKSSTHPNTTASTSTSLSDSASLAWKDCHVNGNPLHKSHFLFVASHEAMNRRLRFSLFLDPFL